MKRVLICLTLLFAVLLCRTPTAEALTYGADNYRQNKQNILAGTYQNDPIWQFINEVETTIAGTSGVTAIYFTPGTAPTAAKGVFYYDLASEGMKVHNGTNWLTIDTAGGTNLDASYNLGNTIDVDGSAVTMTTSNADNNVVLAIVQNEADNDNDAVTITMGSNAIGSALLINSQTGGTDITGDNWSVAQTGVITSVSTIVGASGLVGTQADIFNNETNNAWTFDSDTSTTEDFTIGLGANTNIITFSSASAAATIDFGDMNTLLGMTTITGDAADFTIGSTGNATGEDVIIQQAGTGDNQLTLQSAGSGANALTLLASAAGIDLDAAGSTIVMTNTADGSNDDFTIELVGAQDASLILQSAGTGGDALSLITSNAAGDVKIASADMINIDAADDILIDIAGAAGEDFILTNTGGSIIATASEAIADAINIDASAGGVDIDAIAAFDVAITGGQVLLASLDDAASAIALTANVGSTETIVVTNTQGTAAGAINLTATAGGVNIDAAAAKIVDIDGGSITLENKTAGATAITLTTNQGATDQMLITNTQGTNAAAIDIDATAGGIDIDSAKKIAIDISGAGEDFDVDSAAGSVYLDGGEAAANAIKLDASNAAGGIDIDAKTGGITVDITGAADFRLDSSAGSIYIEGAESATTAIVLAATAGGIDITATSGGSGEDIDITATGGSVNIIGNEAAAQTIVITTAGGGGATETIDITNDQGTAASSTGQTDAAIQIEATAGGISLESGLSAADAIRLETDGAAAQITIQSIAGTGASTSTQQDAAIQLYAEAGGIGLASDLAGADAIRIETSDAAGLITIQSIAGTGASATTDVDAAIQLYAQAGGIGLASDLAGADAIRLETSNASGLMTLQAIAGTGASDSAEEDAAIQLYAQAGGIGLASGLAGDDAIRIEAQGTNGQITIQNKLGTTASAITQFDASIQLYSEVGGIGLLSKLNNSDAIRIEANGGANEIIMILANQGTAAADGVSSIQLLSDSGGIGIKATAETDQDAIVLNAAAGGVDIIAATGKDITLTGGQITLLSNESAASAISLTTNTGAAETIVITNTAGTDEAAIDLTATLGGIKAVFNDAKDLNFEGGQFLFTGNHDAADTIKLHADAGSSQTINILNDAGTNVAAVGITATLGGVTLTSAKAFKVEAPLAFNDVQTIGQDDATPSVSGFSYFNTGTNPDTITDFDGTNIEEGQFIVVISKAAITYDVTGQGLVGGTTDIITASGDVTMWLYDGTDWLLVSWIDNAVDQNGRG